MLATGIGSPYLLSRNGSIMFNVKDPKNPEFPKENTSQACEVGTDSRVNAKNKWQAPNDKSRT